jgi:hypothetical protein
MLKLFKLSACKVICYFLIPFFKGTVPRNFRLQVFFHELVSPKLSIPLGPFQIFSKIPGDIAAQGAPLVSFIRYQMEKNFNQKSFNYLYFIFYF